MAQSRGQQAQGPGEWPARLLTLLGDFACVIDRSGTITSISRSWQLPGRPTNILDWVEASDRRQLRRAIEQASSQADGTGTRASLLPDGQPIEVRICEIVADRLLVTISPLDPPALLANLICRSADAGLAVMDSQGRYVYVNQAYCETYGYSRSELLGREFTMVVAPSQRDAAVENHRATLETGRPLIRELEVLRADGSVMTIDTQSHRVELPDGRVLRLATVHDVTRTRDQERRLNEVESRLRGFTDSLPGAVYQFRHEADGRFRFTYLSRGLHELGGFDPEHPLDDFDTFMGLIPEADREGLQEMIREAERSLTPLRHQFRLRTPNGTLWLEARSTPVQEEDGTVVCNGFLDDITERVESRRALAEIVDNSNAALLIVDPDGRIVHANPQALELLRLVDADGARLSHCSASIEAPDGSSGNAEEQLLGPVLESGQTITDRRLVLRWDDADSRVMSLNGAPLVNEEGVVERVVLSLADVSDRIESHMRTIIEHTPAMVYLKDLEGRFLYINPEFELHYGVRDSWLRGRTVRDLFPRAVAEEFEQRDRQTIAERGLTRREINVPARHGSGPDQVFEALKFPVLDRTGEPVALAGVEIDVTERTEVLRTLRDERQQLEQIVANNVSGLLITDPDGRFIHANNRALQILDTEMSEGQPFRRLEKRLTDPEGGRLARGQRPLQRVLRSRAPVEDMRFALHGDGGRRRVLAINAAPIMDESDEITRIVFSFIDLTREVEARDELAQKNVLFNAIFHDSSETLIVTDTDRRMQMVNPAFTRLFGYREDEVLGKPTRMLYASLDDHRRIGRSYAEREQNRDMGTRTHTIRVRNRDGREFYAESVTDVLHDAEGKPLGYVGLLRDISERKAAEEQLQRERELYASLVESTSAILWEADAATFAFTFVSGESENVLGYTPEDWISDPEFWAGHMHPEDREWAPDFCARATRRREGHSFDYRMIAKDGRVVWLRDIVTVVSENGKPAKLIGVMVDITETKQAEHQLERSEARYRNLYHHTPVLLHSIDADGRLVAVSGFWLEHLGYTESEVIGRPLFDIFTEESARRSREEVLPEFFRTGRCTNVPYQVVRADGTVIDVLLSAVLEHDDDGDISHSLAVMTDVTEQRRAEAQYRDLFNNASEGIYRTSPEGKLLQANPALVRMQGFGCERELIDSIDDLATDWYVQPGDRQRLLSALERDGVVDNFEAEIYRGATGERIWVSENARAVRDDEGRIRHFEGTVVDISWRVRKDQELAQSEARFRTLYHDTPVMLFSSDRDGRVLDVNRFALTQLGYERDEVIGECILDFFTNASRSRARREYLPILLREGAVREQEYRLRRKDGEIRDILLSSSVVFDEEFAVEGVLSVLTDVTERRRLEAEYKDIFENSSEGMFRSTPEGELLRANPALARMQGFATPDELFAAVKDLNADWYVDSQARARMVRMLEQEGYVDGFEAEVQPLNADGRLWTSETVHAARDAKGEVLYYEGTVRDITAQYKAREMARHRNNVLEMIARDDPVTGILYEIVGIAEQQEERLTAAIFLLRHGRLYSAAAPGLSNSCIDAIDGVSPSEVGAMIQDALTTDQEVVATDLDSHGAEGNRFVEAMAKSGYGAIMVAPVRDQEGTVLGVLAGFTKSAHHLDRNCTDMLREMAQITSIAIEQHRLSEALMRQAQYDPLTELPNRALLSDRLERAVAEAERSGHEVGVLLLDLDDFKLVNDSMGHSAGDELLKQVAGRLEECLRGGDTVARLGGDEFVVIVPLAEGGDYCTDIAERILGSLQPTVSVADQEIAARPSIGISIYPQDGRTPEALLKAADTAMYAAKNAGKNQYHFFAENMNRSVSDRLKIESELHDAIRDGALELYFQPRVSLTDGSISGAEGLLRWHHPERGLLLPGAFIEVAERSPLIGAIDRMVMEQAVRQTAALQAAGHRLIMSVNLSAGELHADGFAVQMAQIVEQSGVDPSGLELEITESMLMRDFERASTQLLELRERAPGLRFAIDDFGSGYSSLNYLRHLPVDTLKIDRSFVVGLVEGDETAAAIAKTIVELAHNLNMTVVGEGVELLEQATLLQEFGCEEAQGFLFDPALPMDEFRQRLRNAHAYAGKGSFLPPIDDLFSPEA